MWVTWDESPGATEMPAMTLLSECDQLNRHYCDLLESDLEIMENGRRSGIANR